MPPVTTQIDVGEEGEKYTCYTPEHVIRQVAAPSTAVGV